MTKSNLKNILTAVRDIINRSRIAYKDYLGEETVTETKVLVDGTLSEQGTLTLKDPSFTGFVVGEGYEVTIDGTTQTLTAISNNGVEGITNVINFENPGENYFAVSVNPKKGQPICRAGGTYVGKTISISQTKTTTTKKYDIKKVPQELMPDITMRSIAAANAKAKEANSLAGMALRAADNAQNTADNAQNTADNAQTAANGAAKKVDPVFTGTFSQNRKENTVIGSYSHAEGNNTTASGDYSHAEGSYTTASGNFSHAEGNGSTASKGSSHAEGYRTTANGPYSHTEGYSTTTSGYSSHAEGQNTKASGDYSHAEGDSTTASGSASHAEGQNTTAKGYSSHAEGDRTTASGYCSHVEGRSTTIIPDTITSSSSNSEIIAAWKTAKFSLAKDVASHVEGYDNLALEEASHAEGSYTIASGYCSHAEGKDTKASGNFSHVQGKYNIEDLANTYAHIVGNGSNDNSRSNAHTIDWSGNAWFAGTVEGTALIIPSSTEGSTKKFKITVDDSGTLTATEVTA